MINDLMMIPAFLQSMRPTYLQPDEFPDFSEPGTSGMTPKQYGVMLSTYKKNRKYRGRRKKRG